MNLPVDLVCVVAGYLRLQDLAAMRAALRGHERIWLAAALRLLRSVDAELLWTNLRSIT